MEIQISKIIRSSRRSLSLVVNLESELIIRAPRFLSLNAIEAFVLEKKDWIIKQQAKMANRPQIELRKFQKGENFLYLYNNYLLELTSVKRVRLNEQDFKIIAPNLEPDKIAKLLKNWYQRQAKEVFGVIIQERAKEMNLKPKAWHLSGATRRWGSCSADNVIRINWRLVMADIEKINYVVVHELAHIKHKNHSKRFWQYVESFMPDYRQQRKWLRDNGSLLDW